MYIYTNMYIHSLYLLLRKLMIAVFWEHSVPESNVIMLFLRAKYTVKMVFPISHGRKDWGIENFISPTLLRNMKGKDIKKAISFHMKRNQNLLEPRQKVISWPLSTPTLPSPPAVCCETSGNAFSVCVDFRQANNSNLSLFPLFKQLISAAQLRLNYLQILGELKTYGGKIFNATLMVRILEMWTPYSDERP